MGLSEKNAEKSSPAGWPAWLIGIGVGLVITAVIGVLILQLPDDEPQQPVIAAITDSPVPTVTPTPLLGISPTPLGQAILERQFIPFPPTPTRTPLPTATSTPAPPTIFWSQGEKYALAWMCYGEVGGMLEVKIDACLSVLSTARTLDMFYNAPGSDILGVLDRAFYVPVYTDRPSPDPELDWAVEAYINGARGSCTGYMYFNADPGGPSLCVIRSSNGSWIEFHNGWD
ncbi:MAG: hypothetical protein JXJ17_15060 [Anaerolineae bacterium]|nr:hypothetical protein [Anaerolineae bacterium]